MNSIISLIFLILLFPFSFSLSMPENRAYLQLPEPSLPLIENLFEHFSVIRDKQIGEAYIEIQLASACNLENGKEQEACLREVFGYEQVEAHEIKTTVKEQIYEDEQIRIHAQNHQEARTTGIFTKYLASDLGIDKQPSFSPLDIISPFSHGRGIATADMNNDGYADLAIALEDGIALYANNGDRSFTKIDLDLEKPLNIFVVSFVDFTNDGLPELFYTSYGGDNGYLLNENGNYTNQITLPSSNRLMSLAAGFADIDQDGDIDILLGNWSGVLHDNHIHKYSENELYLNENGSFVQAQFESHLGETLSVLISDLDNTFGPDIIIANDFASPDTLLFSTESGFAPITKEDNRIERTPFYSMSWDSADIDNDLDFDLFGTDMSFLSEDSPYYCDQLLTIEEQIQCQENREMRTIIQRKDAEACLSFITISQQENCLYAIRREIAREKKDPSLCEPLALYPAHYRNCLESASNEPRISTPMYEETAIEQITTNTMLIQNEGGFQDETSTFEVGSSNWSWNASFADLDNDGWQDLYIGNGFHFQGVSSNVFFHNQQGKTFSRSQEVFGLQDYINTPSFVYLDLENDGDLDLIASGVNAPMRVFENTVNRNNTITMSIEDKQGNSAGIGTKVLIEHASNQQMRELKLSGGHLSFHQPILHFGLESDKTVTKATIIWPDGEKYILPIPLEANRHYYIERP